MQTTFVIIIVQCKCMLLPSFPYNLSHSFSPHRTSVPTLHSSPSSPPPFHPFCRCSIHSSLLRFDSTLIISINQIVWLKLARNCNWPELELGVVVTSTVVRRNRLKNAATGCRLSAPGSAEVIWLDLDSPCLLLCSRIAFVRSAPQSPTRSASASFSGTLTPPIPFLFHSFIHR